METSVLTKKIKAWCSSQERSGNEVVTKLLSFGIDEQEIPWIVDDLREEGFINDQRFACQYAGGKFRIKQWGKEKIRLGLQQHGIEDPLIERALEEIDPSDYLRAITQLIEKDKGRKNCDEILHTLVTRGYEEDIITEMMENIGIK